MRAFFRKLFARKPAPPALPKRFDWNSPEGRELIAAEDAKMERELQRVDFAHAFAETPHDRLRHATARLHVLATYFMLTDGRCIRRITMRDPSESP